MIYGFARQSDGHVKIDSEVGKGTTVNLYLPRHHGEAEAPETSEQAAATHQDAGRGQTVLVVEDEPLVRLLIVDVLDELGYQGAGGQRRALAGCASCNPRSASTC